MEENQMSEIFQRLKQAEITDAKQDTEIAVIKKMIEMDIRYIKESLEKLVGGRSEGCLDHTREIEALKVEVLLLKENMNTKAAARSVNALWFVVGGLGFAILVAVVKQLLHV